MTTDNHSPLVSASAPASIDASNLRNIADDCRGLLRFDFILAIEAAADEIDRLMEVVVRLQKERRELKRVNSQ